MLRPSYWERMVKQRHRFESFEVLTTQRDDGSILLENAAALPALGATLPRKLALWAEQTPDAVFLSEGDRKVTFRQAEAARQNLAARLLTPLANYRRGIVIIGNNGINHALVLLATTSVGIPVAVVSPAYVNLAQAPWTKLGRVLEQFPPGAIFADRPELVSGALDDLGKTLPVFALQDLSTFEQGESVPRSVLAEAEANVGPDTISKLLFTSGSTGIPKAVPNTQRMLVSNMQAVAEIWPFLSQRPPTLVDWLPWNHTFGGNLCFHIALWFGGHLHIDQGKPTPTLFDQTIASLQAVKPTIYFSTPLGYELLIDRLEKDEQLAKHFFQDLDFAFNAGAALPGAIRSRIEHLWTAASGSEPRIVGGWGSTETAPFATVLPFSTSHANNLGIPIPGSTIKLVPDFQEGRFELRVRGPNVMPGYWCNTKATEEAFDEEGFYRIGDAGRFLDPSNPAQGILFDGRVVENFKLTSGTFVNVGAVRLAIINACQGLVSDAVITGEGRSEIGALLFPNRSACQEFLGTSAGDLTKLSGSAQLHAHFRELIASLNAQNSGSSMRVKRFLILDEPPNPADDEITDKGYLNQRMVLFRRSAKVDELYQQGTLV